MTYKNSKAARTTITRNIDELSSDTGSVFQTINVLAKRANQISSEMKEELTGKLAEFASHTDNLEEVFENREQIEISKFYERLAKPVAIAIDEYQDDKIFWRNREEEQNAGE